MLRQVKMRHYAHCKKCGNMLHAGDQGMEDDSGQIKVWYHTDCAKKTLSLLKQINGLKLIQLAFSTCCWECRILIHKDDQAIVDDNNGQTKLVSRRLCE